MQVRLYGRSVERGNAQVLAPMAGITDLPYRHICRWFGADITFTEMISAQGLIRDNPNTWSMLQGICAAGEDVVLQLFGSEPQVMGRAAGAVMERVPVRAIDVNMGCPVPKVTRNGAGAALMRDPGKAAAVVQAVGEAVRRGRVDASVSVKIRAGWDEKSANAPEVAAAVSEAGADTIAVHGRTRDMFYSGGANWEWVRAVNDAVSVPVVGNGDVTGPAQAQDMLAATGCAAIMIGRAAVGNPWIFAQLRRGESGEALDCNSTPGRRLAMALFHAELEVRFRGEDRALPFMRQQLHSYVWGMPGAAALRDGINRCGTLSELAGLLHNYAEGAGWNMDYSEVDEMRTELPGVLRSAGTN